MDGVPVSVSAILLAVGLLIVLVAALVRQGYQKKQLLLDRRDVWKEVARKLDGDFKPGSDELWAGQVGSGASLEVTVDGVTVLVRLSTRTSGSDTSSIYTTLQAKATAPSGMSLKIYAETFFSKIGRAVGLQDVQIGDAAFDDAFMVKANDEVFARAWLNATVRKRMLNASNFEFRLKGGRVEVEAPGFIDDPVALEKVIRAVAAFADGKHHVVRVFKKLAKRLGGKARKEEARWASLTADVAGTPITVDTLEHGTSHFNVVTARVVGAKLIPLVLTNSPREFSPTLPLAEMPDLPTGYGAWTTEPQRAASQLPEAVKEQIRALKPIKVRLDEEQVRVFSDGICPPIAQMQRAVNLAAAIAATAHR